MRTVMLTGALLVGLAGWPAALPVQAAERAGVGRVTHPPDFAKLDEAAARADACEAKAREAYDSGDNARILEALSEQGKCLEVILFGIAREFYPTDAFGSGGVEARMAEMRKVMGNLYSTIYSEPLTCAPNCGAVYQIWAAEAYVTSVRIMLDDMLDRLKDESPIHRP